MKLSKSRYVAFTAIGVALYVALGFAVQVPVFENYYVYLGYVVMLLYAYVFGTGPACAVGGIGCILYCLLTSGLRGMPGWTLGNIAMGLIIGLTFKKTARMTNRRMKLVSEIATVALACLTGILLIKSCVEVVLYAQPMAVRMAKNVFAFVADLIVLEVSIPVCHALAPACERIAYRTGTPVKTGDTP